jgi:hypothetical protein
MTCPHRHIKTIYSEDDTFTKYWACSECRVKFVPSQQLGQKIEDFNEVEKLSNLGKQILKGLK